MGGGTRFISLPLLVGKLRTISVVKYASTSGVVAVFSASEYRVSLLTSGLRTASVTTAYSASTFAEGEEATDALDKLTLRAGGAGPLSLNGLGGAGGMSFLLSMRCL